MNKVITVIVSANMSMETEHSEVNKALNDGYLVESVTAVPSATHPFTTIVFVLRK